MLETDNGPIEYATTGKKGPWIVGFHGGPGGYDQSLLLWHDLPEGGYRLLSWSRPGYLRTPVATGKTIADQTYALIHLLDGLGIGRVGIIGFSAGGACALDFAGRFPERVWAVVVESAVAKPYRMIPPGNISEQLFARLMFNDPAVWLYNVLAEFAPQSAISAMIETESTLDEQTAKQVLADIMTDPEKIHLAMDLIKSMSPFSLREAGLENDLEQLAALHDLPLEQITAPTLIIHGTADGDVPFEHAEHASRQIPMAELHPVKNGFHILALSKQSEAIRNRRLKHFNTAAKAFRQ